MCSRARPCWPHGSAARHALAYVMFANMTYAEWHVYEHNSCVSSTECSCNYYSCNCAHHAHQLELQRSAKYPCSSVSSSRSISGRQTNDVFGSHRGWRTTPQNSCSKSRTWTCTASDQSSGDTRVCVHVACGYAASRFSAAMNSFVAKWPCLTMYRPTWRLICELTLVPDSMSKSSSAGAVSHGHCTLVVVVA